MPGVQGPVMFLDVGSAIPILMTNTPRAQASCSFSNCGWALCGGGWRCGEAQAVL